MAISVGGQAPCGDGMKEKERQNRRGRGEDLDNACDHCTRLDEHRRSFRLLTALPVNLSMRVAGHIADRPVWRNGCNAGISVLHRG